MSSIRARASVVGTGDSGTAPALLVCIFRAPPYGAEIVPIAQLLVNCGECACRVANERRHKLSALRAVLLTRLAPRHVAGLPSAVFHMSDLGIARCIVAGPPGTTRHISATSAFIRRTFPELVCVDVGSRNADAGEQAAVSVASATAIASHIIDRVPMEALFAWGRAVARDPGMSVQSIFVPLVNASSVPRQSKRPRALDNNSIDTFGRGIGQHLLDANSDAVVDTFAIENVIIHAVTLVGPADATAIGSVLAGRHSCAESRRHHVSMVNMSNDNDSSVSEIDSNRSTCTTDSSSTDTCIDSGSAAVKGGGLARYATTILFVDCPSSFGVGPVHTALSAWHVNRDSAADGGVSHVFHLGDARVSRSLTYGSWFLDHTPHAAHVIIAPILPEDGGNGIAHGLFPAAERQADLLAQAEPALFGDAAGCSSVLGTTRRNGSVKVTASMPLQSRAHNAVAGWNPVTLSATDSVELVPAPDSNAGEPAASICTVSKAAFDSSPPVVKPCESDTCADGVCPPPVQSCDASATTFDVRSNNRDVANALRRELLKRSSQMTSAPALHLDADVAKGGSLVSSDPATLRQVSAPPNPQRPGQLVPRHAKPGPSLVFLGTGAAAPSRLRSCSGILVRLPTRATAASASDVGSPRHRTQASSFLLDCGEGCVNKLLLLAHGAACRTQHGACPRARWHALLLDIRFVWISHFHADHHTGLLALLAEFSEATACATCALHFAAAPNKPQTLFIVGPQALGTLLAAYDYLFPRRCYVFTCNAQWRLLDNSSRNPGHNVQVCDAQADTLCCTSGIRAFTPVKVDHCRDSYGCIATLEVDAELSGGDPELLVLVYSGDTRPCRRLVDAAAAAVGDLSSAHVCTRHVPLIPSLRSRQCISTLLIHEATMNDDRASDAAAKRHSCVGEALDVASRLRAAIAASGTKLLGTVLTHFSQRYPSVGTLTSSATQRIGAESQEPGPTLHICAPAIAIESEGRRPQPADSSCSEHTLSSPARTLFACDGLCVPLGYAQLDAIMSVAPRAMARMTDAIIQLS